MSDSIQKWCCLDSAALRRGGLLEEEGVLVISAVVIVHQLLMADGDHLPALLPQGIEGGLNGVEVLVGLENRIDPFLHKETSWQTPLDGGKRGSARSDAGVG